MWLQIITIPELVDKPKNFFQEQLSILKVSKLLTESDSYTFHGIPYSSTLPHTFFKSEHTPSEVFSYRRVDVFRAERICLHHSDFCKVLPHFSSIFKGSLNLQSLIVECSVTVRKLFLSKAIFLHHVVAFNLDPFFIFHWKILKI